MENYIIMHKERKVASIRRDGSCTIYAPSFMPYNLYFEKAAADDMDGRMNNINNFYYWCASRLLTLDRKYAKEILNSLGKPQAVTDRERAEISISYHSLSLTDVYWVRKTRERVTFSEINLYDHPLSDAFVDVCLRGRGMTAQNAARIHPLDVAGDAATVGVAPKAWIRRNGVFYLLKDGDARDVEAELLAGKIADCFDIAHVVYEKDTYDGAAVSASKIITSKDRSIVPMEYISIYTANCDLDWLAFVLKKDAYGYYMMNIVDYLVGNTDRHWGNWGFFVNNENNKLEQLHPLMDFNKAFLGYDTEEGFTCLTTGAERKSQKDAAIEAVEHIGLNLIKEPKEAWFDSEAVKAMFFRRLEILKQYQK